MNSQVFIGTVLILGPIILVACVANGLFGFTPERAHGIRAAESQNPVVYEEIRRIHIRAPDHFRHDRLDRHPFYIGAHVAVWCYAWCVFAGAPITGNLANLTEGTKMTMAVGFLVGSSLALAGAAMGVRIGRVTILRGIRDNIASAMLADDIRLPYTFSCAGLFAVGVSTGIYSATSFQSTLGSLGGWWTGVTTALCVQMILMFYSRVRRYERARATLIREAVAQIEHGHGCD